MAGHESCFHPVLNPLPCPLPFHSICFERHANTFRLSNTAYRILPNAIHYFDCGSFCARRKCDPNCTRSEQRSMANEIHLPVSSHRKKLTTFFGGTYWAIWRRLLTDRFAPVSKNAPALSPNLPAICTTGGRKYVCNDSWRSASARLTCCCHLLSTLRRYCGGTWRSIIDKLDYIQGMGIDAIWIS